MSVDDPVAALRNLASALSECDGCQAPTIDDADGPNTLCGRCWAHYAALRAEVERLKAVLDEVAPEDPANAPRALSVRVAAEMRDFQMVIDHASRVFCHITSSRISKPNTDPAVVCAVADDLESERQREAIEEAMEELKDEYRQVAELFFGEAEYEHEDVMRRVRDYMAEFDAVKAAFALYVEWNGAVHVGDCPEDDTCDCAGKPVNDAVNAALRGYTRPAGVPA